MEFVYARKTPLRYCTPHRHPNRILYIVGWGPTETPEGVAPANPTNIWKYFSFTYVYRIERSTTCVTIIPRFFVAPHPWIKVKIRLGRALWLKTTPSVFIFQAVCLPGLIYHEVATYSISTSTLTPYTDKKNANILTNIHTPTTYECMCMYCTADPSRLWVGPLRLEQTTARQDRTRDRPYPQYGSRRSIALPAKRPLLLLL